MLIIPYLISIADNGHLESEQSYCPFKMLTGFPCPGCGITKSMVYFFQGDISKSLSFHIFGPFFVVIFVLAIFVLSAELATGKEYFNRIVYSKKLAYFLAAVLIVYHLIRLIIFISENSFDDILRESIWR